MKYPLLLLFLSFFFLPDLKSQTIPYLQCGLQYTYDASGNLISREYICNNTPPGPRMANPINNDSLSRKPEDANVVVQQVDALYPNPTTGRFNITFSQPLENATVRIIDLNGKLLQQFKANGTLIQCDISTLPAGIYNIVVPGKNSIITKRVIKQ